MAKQITFQDNNGKTWTLEFNRATAKEVQNRGFDSDQVLNRSLTMLPLLWEGAFLMHHRYEKKEVIDNLLEKMGDKQELFGKLSEMFNEPVETTLLNEPESSVKVDWTANW